MNKTTFFIVVGVLFVGGLLTLAYLLSGPAKSPITTVQNIGLPIASTTVQNGTVGISSVTNVGEGAIQTVNFLSDPTTVKDPNNEGYYYLGHQASDNSPYVITYISATQYFNVALLQEPIGPVRKDAEQYLMTRLGISQNQMCQLDYMVSVPDRVNSQYSGINLGFSFCPGATVLPE